jgi:hypothetical protein
VGGLPRAFDGRRQRSKAAAVARARVAKATGAAAKPTVPLAQLRDLGLRPNWQRAKDFPPMEEDEPGIGLAALVRAGIARRRLGGYHTGIAIGSDEGYPDYTIWGPGGLLFPELKGTRGRLYVAQLDVILGLRAAGADACVWWPEDYYLGVIDNELDRLAGIRPTDRTVVLRPGYRRCGCHMDAKHTCATWGGGESLPRS